MRDIQDHHDVSYDWTTEGDATVRTSVRRFGTRAEADAFADRLDAASAGTLPADVMTAAAREDLPADAVLTGTRARRLSVRVLTMERPHDGSGRPVEALPTPVAWMALKNLDHRDPWTNTQPTRRMAEHAAGSGAAVLIPLFAGMPPSPGYLEGMARLRAVVIEALVNVPDDVRDAVLAACDVEVTQVEKTSPRWGRSLPEVVHATIDGPVTLEEVSGLAVWPSPVVAEPVDVAGRVVDALAGLDAIRDDVGDLRRLLQGLAAQV